jgi:hypothetical protein
VLEVLGDLDHCMYQMNPENNTFADWLSKSFLVKRQAEIKLGNLSLFQACRLLNK